jgi:hypothetical protein
VLITALSLDQRLVDRRRRGPSPSGKNTFGIIGLS